MKEGARMATQRPFLSDLAVRPLLNLNAPDLVEQYQQGVSCCLHRKHNRPLSDRDVIATFHSRKTCWLDAGDEQSMRKDAVYFIGMVHGGLLLPDGTLRRTSATLVTLDEKNAQRGYYAGRQFHFLDADTEEEWYMTDAALIDELRDLAHESVIYQGYQHIVAYALGSLLGRLSGQLFPWTRQEQHAFEAESIKFLGYV